MSSVASVIEKLTGVPASKLGQSEMARLRSMKEVLENIVIGQPEAIMDVVKSLQRNALGLRDPKKPIASLMMIGPTGSGKTYLSKIIAKEFFGTQDALIRFDMSEFTERHEVTKLIGSTASYVGYEDEPLFEKVRNRPHSVVLFDEIEKAAPEIYQIFLNILDEGSITLGNGKQVSFRNCLIIFTGNIGTKELGLGKIGFDGGELNNEEIESVVKKALKKTFSPEFINRLTKTTVFRKLTNEDLSKICVLEIKKFSERLATQGYSLDVDEGVIEKIVETSDKLYGARDIQRGITRYIETPVADKLLEDGVEGKNIKVELDNVTIN
jgi:ATP-dependent Clp protease ATP-binding subunit ClpC